MLTEKPLITIVIPVKNGDHWLKETIPAILGQKIPGSIEIIAIDSGSTDESLKILSGYPVTVVHIKPAEFNHGLTRNLGASLAKGKFVVMTVQDAKPASDVWLQQMLDGLIDNNVVAVCGQQMVPHHHDKNPVEWYRPISLARLKKIHFPNPGDFKKLSPQEQLSFCRWDDVNTMYRKDILMELPFRRTDFAEDVLWAKDALLKGYAIVFNPVARVEHYHHENYNFAFRRNFIVQYHLYKYFGTVPGKLDLSIRMLKILKLLMREKMFTVREKWNWLEYNYKTLLAIEKSNKAILKAISTGGEAQLENLYHEVCSIIPQALKNNTK